MLLELIMSFYCNIFLTFVALKYLHYFEIIEIFEIMKFLLCFASYDEFFYCV